MQKKWARYFGTVLLALSGVNASADAIKSARYADPTVRYGHFALGKPHEYATLEVSAASGRQFSLQLPDEEVFEDLAPRLVKLSADAPATLLTIVSHRRTGARLVLYELNDKGLSMTAQSDPIGTPNRWLNPVGVVDLDGDGQAEISAVITPHIAGTLKVYRRNGSELAELAALPGLSNHAYGSTVLDMSLPVSIAEKTYLLLPDQQHSSLRLITLRNKQLIEVGRCALRSKLIGTVTLAGAGSVSAVTAAGPETLQLSRCINPV